VEELTRHGSELLVMSHAGLVAEWASKMKMKETFYDACRF
jgi:hypothetical protein